MSPPTFTDAQLKRGHRRHIKTLQRRLTWLVEQRIPRSLRAGHDVSYDIVETQALRYALAVLETFGAAFDEVRRET